jgi:hypothetical protein
MIHKRYSYKKPLLWAAFFLAIFLRTNTISDAGPFNHVAKNSTHANSLSYDDVKGNSKILILLLLQQ